MRMGTEKLKAVRVAGIVAIILVAGGLGWFTANRLRELDQQLKASEQRAEAVNERLREYSRELELALETATAARRRASSAEQEAEEATAARLQAEQQTEEATTARLEAESGRDRAQQQARQARTETSQTREELERVRQQREDELNRMQEALNRIAPTRRTPSGMVMMLSGEAFRFDFDKAILKPANREMLSRVAGILLASEGYRLFVDGHTDDIGTDEYNQDLSERRAEAVQQYLVAAGIPASAVAVQGFGKSQPLVKEKTKVARARNRRVEIGIVDTIVHYEEAVRN